MGQVAQVSSLPQLTVGQGKRPHRSTLVAGELSLVASQLSFREGAMGKEDLGGTLDVEDLLAWSLSGVYDGSHVLTLRGEGELSKDGRSLSEL